MKKKWALEVKDWLLGNYELDNWGLGKLWIRELEIRFWQITVNSIKY